MPNDQQITLHDAAPTVVSISGDTFGCVEDLIAFIDELPEEDRYRAQSDALNRMLQMHDNHDESIESFYNYIRNSGVWRRWVSEEEFLESWAPACDIVLANQKRRDRLAEARTNILKRWETPRAVAWIARPEHSPTFLASVRQLAASSTFEHAVPYINRAIMSRFITPSRGVAKIRGPTVTDIVRVRAGKIEPFDIMPHQVAALGLRYGAEGILEPDDGTAVSIAEDAMIEVDFPRRAGEITDAAPGSTPSPGPPRPTNETLSVIDTDIAMTDAPPHEVDAASPPVSQLTSREPTPPREEISVDIAAIEGAEQDLRLESEAQAELPAAGTTNPETERLVGAPRSAGSCRCSQDVPECWKKSVMQKRELGLATDMKLLSRMQGYKHVCFAHAKALGGHIGLMVKQLDYPGLVSRLRLVHERRLELGKLKTSPETFSWFRVANRPARPSDMLGPYKFVHQTPARFQYDQTKLLQRLGIDITDWVQDGSINVSIFSWWFEGPIGRIIDLEFDMYRHHLREINGKPNYGWLRNSFYSTAQQLMRQDPLYYALYAALRPDQQWRLVSYPYYAKYAVKGDQTYFRHIDLNVPDLLSSQRGSSMIQGSVSIDNETNQDCTVIIAGMHRKLQQWWDICFARGQETSGFVHRITDQMFTPNDAKKLNVDWKRVPCRRGEVRVTLPHIPHGADGPTVSTRRTMLPWFVGLQDDGEALEVIEGGTWSDLAAAHRDLVSPVATPSGLANRYGAIPYRFPAAVEVASLGALSDALVCRRRWDSPAVLQERDIMLCGSLEVANQYVKEWRERAVRVAVETFALVKQEEVKAFGDRSYFYHLERFETEGIPFPLVIEDKEEIDPEIWENDPTVQLRFAEEGVGSV
jgi:hypothetical protein